ncbi:hypothetical protein C8J56DRAFT_1045751 [Mycena floridula]|nr:hypothetical protein C8J56DRAFT_1045751 [Mycena floridula]
MALLAADLDEVTRLRRIPELEARVDQDVRQYLRYNIVIQRRVKLEAQLVKAVQSLRDVDLYHARLSAEELDAQVQAFQEKRMADGQDPLSTAGRILLRYKIVKERQAEVKAEIEESTRILRAMEAEYNELVTADIEEEVTKFEETSGPLDTKQRENLKDQIAQQKQDAVDIRIAETSEMLNSVGREHESSQVIDAQKSLLAFYADTTSNAMLNDYLKQQSEGYLGARLAGEAHFLVWMSELDAICVEQHLWPPGPTESDKKLFEQERRLLCQEIHSRLWTFNREHLGERLRQLTCELVHARRSSSDSIVYAPLFPYPKPYHGPAYIAEYFANDLVVSPDGIQYPCLEQI